MAEPEIPLHPLMPILLRFSGESAAIRQLVIDDEAFRCLVEDYLLAHNTLKTMQKQTPPKLTTIAEYATLLQDLESEINKYLLRSRGGNL